MTQPRPLPARIVTPQAIWSGDDVLAASGEVVRSWGRRVACVAGLRAWDAAGPVFERAWVPLGFEVVRLPLEGEAEGTAASVERLSRGARVSAFEIVIGCGGGRAIDTAKLLAAALGLPCITVPTVVSVSAAWTAVADLLDDAGAWQGREPIGSPPAGVVVDHLLLRQTPSRMFASALAAAAIEMAVTPDEDAPLAWTGRELVKALRDLMRREASHAIRGARAGRFEAPWRQSVEAFFHLAGLAGGVRGNDRPPRLALSVARALTAVPGVASSHHGERLAFGAVVETLLGAGGEVPVLDLVAFHAQLGLPLSLRALGSSDDARRISALARRVSILDSGNHDAISINEAIHQADALGKVASACRPIQFPGSSQDQPS